MLWPWKKQNRRIYADTAAATPLDRAVARTLWRLEAELVGNPSSIHQEGLAAARVLKSARTDVAHILGARPGNIVFTSGGTEGNNLALIGAARAYKKKFGRSGRIITSAIEHKSILGPVRALERDGWDVVILQSRPDGQVDLGELEAALSPETAIVSISYVNNEIGTVAPLAAIAKIVRRVRRQTDSLYPLFHSDACQAPRFFPLAVSKLGVDLMTLNGSKIYGPKGFGVLYRSETTAIEPLVSGGGQEEGLRSGSQNAAAAAAFAQALSICERERDAESVELSRLRDHFFEVITRTVPGLRVHGSWTERAPNNINITLPGVDAEWAVVCLDERGIAASTGSACSTDLGDERHVLTGLYGNQAPQEGSIRLTLGRGTSEKDIRRVIESIAAITGRT